MIAAMQTSEETLAQALLDAQEKAGNLFAEIESQGLIRAARKESEINEEIYALAGRIYGIEKYWHKRIVRAGRNTLAPYAEDPPDMVVAEDDIIFLDLGPVFEEWEADFGRTFVLGNDPWKQKLCRDIAEGFAKGKQYFKDHEDITGAELFHYVEQLATSAGWEFGGTIAGHLIGVFPHERIPNDKITLYVHPQNPNRMRQRDASGRMRHWILEIHFVDRAREIGGFYEELLTVG
jgi:Xaa-Pro dipeptidase